MKIKLISSLEKVFLGQKIDSLNTYNKTRALKNELVSYQIVLKSKVPCKVRVTEKSACVNIRLVGMIPSAKPIFKEKYDDYYLTDKPGLFPDVLYENYNIVDVDNKNTVFWISINTKDLEIGKNNINIKFEDIENRKIYESNFELTVINLELPHSDLIYSNWLYADCISNYYNLVPKSEKHWWWIEKFIKKASELGVSMILTPIFTLPLDTVINGERPTFQLINVKYDNGKYAFQFDDFERWISICKKHNISYFEMGHLFTQWGAKATPKIEVLENNKIIKKFGWHIQSNSPEYKEFLEQFLPELDKELQKLNISSNIYFHISDEPSKDDIDNYKYASNLIKDILNNKYPIVDALSNVEFYDNKLVEIPLPATSKYDPFFERNISKRLCYYCGYNSNLVSNRLFSMPSYRNRIFGIQLYYLNFVGFLQWGFNFYNTQFSLKNINPFEITDGGEWVPSGDAFIVYPGDNEVLDSIRGIVFYEGLQDRMRLKLLEAKIGRVYTLKIIEDLANTKITFKNYPHHPEFILELKEKVIDELLKN